MENYNPYESWDKLYRELYGPLPWDAKPNVNVLGDLGGGRVRVPANGNVYSYTQFIDKEKD